MASTLMEYFNRAPRIGTLSTSSKNGAVDVAVFGSPQMVDDKTVVMGLGKNRTLANLQENPHAVFMIMEPGKTIMDWKGIRVYLKRSSLETSGRALDAIRGQIAKVAGEQAAQMISAAVIFEITEIRPIMDMGQGWERSI